MTRRPPAKPLAALLGALVFASAATVAATLDDLQRAIDAGRFEQAARESQAYLAEHPGNRDARFVHARALAGLDDDNAAIAAFKPLAEDFPLRVEPANNLAVLYARLGEYDKARRWLDKALATQPAYAVAHRNLGDVYTALADLAYRRALGSSDSGSKTGDNRLPLRLLDHLYYARESVKAGDAGVSPRAAPEKASENASDKPTSPPPAADDSENIIQTVRAWALAWSSQQVDTYIDFYAADFVPGDGMDRRRWRALRRTRLEKPGDIRIRIENPSITRVSSDRVRVDFVQRYQSPRYSDMVNKRLLMQRTPAGWRILRETSAIN